MKINTLACPILKSQSQKKTRVCPDQSERSLICRREKEDDDYLEMMTVLTRPQTCWTNSLR